MTDLTRRDMLKFLVIAPFVAAGVATMPSTTASIARGTHLLLDNMGLQISEPADLGGYLVPEEYRNAMLAAFNSEQTVFVAPSVTCHWTEDHRLVRDD